MHNSPRPKPGVVDLLDRVRLTDSERDAARAAMAQGERIADLVLKAYAAQLFLVRGAERALRALTRARSTN